MLHIIVTIFAVVKTKYIIFSFVLSSLILLNSLRVTATYAYYKIDPVGFIEKLCENKDKPVLQCNGKCHLKKVAESTPIDSQEPTQLIDFKEILLYSQELHKYNFSSTISIKKAPIEYQNLYTSIDLNSCFRPPQV